jgi:hypothetical protein
MKFLACLDDPMPSSGECVATAWVEYPAGFFTGWTTNDLAICAGAILGLWAVLLIFRVLIQWGQSDINV